MKTPPKVKRLLLEIEMLAANGEVAKDYQGQAELRMIFHLTHSFNSPDCGKNHPKWTEELRKI